MRNWIESILGDGKLFYDYLAKPALIFIAAVIMLRLSGILVDRLTKASFGKAEDLLRGKRRDTIRGLLKNLAKYVVWFVAVVSILDCYHVPVMAVLSTVGVVGVALAFGAQSLCKDIITGFFILLEDQYFVGEYIEAQGVAGYVEQFTLRCTFLRDFDGRLHIVPNGSINLVTNHHRGNRRVMVEIGIAYDKDIGEALKLLQKVCDEINELKKDVIRERITALGVVDMTVSGVVIRMLGKAETMMQWDVERVLRRTALEALSQAGYDIPYPHSHVIVEPYHD
jgi:small conductance mechanosensitive channel